MNVPNELKYTKNHEWVKIDGDTAIIGVTDYAQEQLTDVVFVELPENGKTLNKEDALATVESVKSVSDIFSPVSGEVIEINSELENEPELINNSPYEKGWIAKIKFTETKDNLMTAEEYEKTISEGK